MTLRKTFLRLADPSQIFFKNTPGAQTYRIFVSLVLNVTSSQIYWGGKLGKAVEDILFLFIYLKLQDT